MIRFTFKSVTQDQSTNLLECVVLTGIFIFLCINYVYTFARLQVFRVTYKTPYRLENEAKVYT